MFKMIGLCFVCLSAIAQEAPIRLENANLNTRDVKSVVRGAHNFATYCLVCHSLEYMAHDPIAKSAGITLATMPDKNKKWWFGASPPDLSLIARVHTADWIYTYLHSFYVDKSRAIGSNNLLQDNVNMPNPFVGIQGQQILLVNKNQLFNQNSLFTIKLPYYSVLDLTKEGNMTPDQFDQMLRDLVNFLVYTSEPKKYTREMMGIWVLSFIAILLVLFRLLKKEYWKRVK
jgi:ubiquinol-cytochrome c reductase cytochrome c1 subunit